MFAGRAACLYFAGTNVAALLLLVMACASQSEGSPNDTDGSANVESGESDSRESTATSPATPTSTLVPTPTTVPRQSPTSPVGSDQWWLYVAPINDFEQNVTTLGSDTSENFHLLYASVFVLDSWLEGADPWERDFGDFVRTTSFGELPQLALRDFNNVSDFGGSETWAQHYVQPKSLSEFTLLTYVAWAVCLVERSWDECESTTKRVLEDKAFSFVYIPNLTDYKVAWSDAGYRYSSSVDKLFSEYANVWLALVAIRRTKPTDQSFINFVRTNPSGDTLREVALTLVPAITNEIYDRDAMTGELAHYIVRPSNEARSNIGCWLAYAAAIRTRGSFIGGNLGITPSTERCDDRFIEYRVQIRTGEISTSWIRWIALKHGLSY